MIDFAEVLNINVFQLNKIYLKLIKLLHFEIKKNDPSLYVPRFLKALKFEQDKEKEILEFVLKLLAKMRRNWLAKGRRPSGLIAACFYIACRCFNIEKSYKEISKVLKVSEETIRKRVNEFSNLEVAQLSKEEFQKLSIENDHFTPEDPPAFKKAQLMDEMKRKKSLQQIKNYPETIPEGKFKKLKMK